MKQAFFNVLLVMLSILFCLMLGEAIIRGVNYYRPGYDFEMWRYASELKQPLRYAGLPFHHYPNRKGSYYGVEIRTNALGFRDREYSLRKPDGLKRIIILGDSMALGWGVHFIDTASEQLERMLNSSGNNYEVINMGTGNYNSSMEVELLKHKGLALEPDMVVLFYFINDTEPTPSLTPLSYNILSRSYLMAYTVESLKKLKTAAESNDRLMDYYRSIYSETSVHMEANSDAIRELAKVCSELNIKLLIVNIPDLRRLEGYPFTFATDHIRALAESSHAPFLDLLSIFDRYDGKSLWVSPEDPHMNSLANAMAADAIYRSIMDDSASGLKFNARRTNSSNAQDRR